MKNGTRGIDVASSLLRLCFPPPTLFFSPRCSPETEKEDKEFFMRMAALCIDYCLQIDSKYEADDETFQPSCKLQSIRLSAIL